MDAAEASPELRLMNSFILFLSPYLCLFVLRSLCSAPLRYANLPPHPPGAYLACNKCKCTYFENAALIIMLIDADAYGNPV
jgi:hypothetical protein